MYVFNRTFYFSFNGQKKIYWKSREHISDKRKDRVALYFSIAVFIFKAAQGEKTGIIYDLESWAVSPGKSLSAEKPKICQQWSHDQKSTCITSIRMFMTIAVSQEGPC